MIKHYSSIAEMRSEYLRLGGQIYTGRNSERDSWFNHETEQQTQKYCLIGKTDLVPEAEQLINKLETEISIPRKIWIPSPAGAFPIIPDYLRGLPTNMRRRIEEKNESAPIRIYVITTCSAGVDAKTLQKRGTAILALTIALSKIRPISLYQLTIMEGDKDQSGETILAAEINTHPLDLATACYILTSAGFARRITYSVGHRLNIKRSYNGQISWPGNYHKCDYLAYLTKTLSQGDINNTLIIKESYITDPLLSNPILWINTQIKKFTQPEEEK